MKSEQYNEYVRGNIARALGIPAESVEVCERGTRRRYIPLQEGAMYIKSTQGPKWGKPAELRVGNKLAEKLRHLSWRDKEKKYQVFPNSLAGKSK